MQKITRLILPVLVGLMLLLNMAILLPVANEVGAQTIKERFSGILVDHDADINGDIDVDGTANLDVVDIDGAVDFAAALDLNGNELTLDADADTSITVDTDDQIDVEIAGADEFVITADQIDATNGQIVNIGAAGTDFSTSGGLTLADALTVTSGGATLSDGDLVIADDLRVTAQTSITVTDGAAFTPTGTYQPIAAAGEVTPTITAGATAGDMVVLINTSAQVVRLADSGTLKLTAAGALNQFDTLTLWSDGTNWIEISRTDN